MARAENNPDSLVLLGGELGSATVERAWSAAFVHTHQSIWLLYLMNCFHHLSLNQYQTLIMKYLTRL